VIDGERNRFTGRPVTEVDWYRMVPPPRKLRWSLRNNTNYMETAVLAALQFTARNAGEMLRNFWRRGANAVRKGASEKPYAIAIPEQQDDRRRLARLLNLLREHAIEVQRAAEAFKLKQGEYPAGTYLVRMDQPYRGFALDLLVPQKYPADKAPYDAYDDVAWALPVALGVETQPIDDEAVRQVKLEPVTQRVAYQGRVAREGAYYLVRDSGQEALLAARARLAGFEVEAAEKAFSAGGKDYPAGSWILAAQPGLRSALERVAAELAIDVDAVPGLHDVKRHRLELPRLALLQTWSDTQSAGWVRMIFDDQRIPYTLIDPRHAPLAYTKTSQFPTHGSPSATADMTGGLSWSGIQNIEEFVRKGGVLVTLGGASTLPLDGGIARDVRRAPVKGLTNPGSELRVRFRRPEHPLAYGYPETTSVFREGRPVYAVRRVDEGRIVLQWGTKIPKHDEEAGAGDEKAEDGKKEPPLVVSGGIKGGEELVGKPALLDIEVGEGRVIAFDFDPIHATRPSRTFAWSGTPS
jgi:hypothetical protein